MSGAGQAASNAAWPSGGGNVGQHRRDADAAGLAYFLGGLLEQGLVAAVDDHGHARLGERLRAATAQTLTGRADNGGAAANP